MKYVVPAFLLLLAACGGGGGGNGNGDGDSDQTDTDMTSCTPGANRCNGNDQELCSASGTWGVAQTCQFGCDVSTRACLLDPAAACTAGDQRCNGSNVETCASSSNWTTTTTCSFGCVDSACRPDPSTTCTQGAQRCLNDRVTQQTCQANGTWAEDFNCPFTCYAGACVGDCGPGSQACCVRYQDGTEGCSNNTISQCYGTNCSSIDGNPVVSVFIATCNDMGKLAESSVCPACVSSLGPNGTETTAQCNYCPGVGGTPAPRCDSSQGCNGCPQP